MAISEKVKCAIELPAMYADHHVMEVRRILSELPSVENIYASSCFGIVELWFDPQQLTPEQIQDCLEKAGYLGDLNTPKESQMPASEGSGEPVFYRHTSVYEVVRSSVSFGQVVSYLGRPLWQCPGLGAIKAMEEE